MVQCLHIKIEGKVFKTGYRYYLKQKASHLDIHGRVYYHPDHSVGVIASGHKPKLEEFVMYCHCGNKDSYVEQIIVNRMPCKAYPTFEVTEEFQIEYQKD